MRLPLRFFVLTLCSLVAMASCQAAPPAKRSPASHKKRLVVANETDPVVNPAISGRSFAVVIGINQYPHLPPGLQLHYAVRDATEIRDVLAKNYGFPPANIKLLTDAKASSYGIQEALSELTDIYRLQSNDRLLIYFSGHGQTVRTANGTATGFLIPSDAIVDMNHLDNPAPYLKTCLQMSRLWEYLDYCKAKHILIVADSCFSGLLAEPAPPRTDDPAAQAGRASRQVITAGAANQSAGEDAAHQHGLFTFGLLKSLRGHATPAGGLLTTEELFAELKSSVPDVSQGQQTPQMGDHQTDGTFPFIAAASQPISPVLVKNNVVHPHFAAPGLTRFTVVQSYADAYRAITARYPRPRLTAFWQENPTFQFPDVPVDHPTYEALSLLTSVGFVIGNPDGTFGGKKIMTRYELSLSLVRFRSFIRGASSVPDAPLEPPKPTMALPTDVSKDHWAWNSVNSLVKDGILTLDADGKFRGNDPATVDVLTAALHRFLPAY